MRPQHSASSRISLTRRPRLFAFHLDNTTCVYRDNERSQLLQSISCESDHILLGLLAVQLIHRKQLTGSLEQGHVVVAKGFKWLAISRTSVDVTTYLMTRSLPCSRRFALSAA
jgi:hypothetical protein